MIINVAKNLVYGLVDPHTNKVMYIGKSATWLSRPYDQLTRHKKLNEPTEKNKWLNQLIKNNTFPKIKILRQCKTESEAFEYEKIFITKYRKSNKNLFNITKGGRGGDTGGSQKRKIKVIAKNLFNNIEKEYESVQHTKIDGFIPTKVSAICRGKSHSHKGYTFKYYNSIYHNIPNKRQKIIIAIDKNTNNIFKFISIRQASKYLGINTNSISMDLNNKTNCRNYAFTLFNIICD